MKTSPPSSATTIFLYPGQGAQHVGMGKALYRAHRSAKKIFDQADQHLGFSLSRCCFEGPESVLNQDLTAQLAVYTTSCAVTTVLQGKNIFPAMVTGYSSGFYAAAYAAGCFDFSTGLDIVRRAGEILLSEGRKIEGGMAAVFGLSKETVAPICREVGNVSIAIYNTTRQIVISGLKQPLETVIEKCRKNDALDAYFLPVATAYHSPFVDGGCDRFITEFPDEHFRDLRMPIYSYSFLKTMRTGPAVKRCMAEQLTHPVYWVDLIQNLRDKGYIYWLEIGPGAMLSRSVRWIDRNIDIMHTARAKDIHSVIERFGGK